MPQSRADATSADVHRISYMVGSKSTSNAGLSFQFPSGNNTITRNLTNSSSIFTMQNQLFDSVTVTGPIVFSLWLSSNKTGRVTLGLTLAGGFNVRTVQITEYITMITANVSIFFAP